ncbi:unnamed protein product [Adineta ricciae]|uniref:Thiamin pyrophosphokinase thiamin-binding domain-containing protein n=1 Tax=Adineta ricciae TaxID=249248 RepID=A0A814J7X1_ADIRI|nr:unnamed protein product [Adineta ricciae]
MLRHDHKPYDFFEPNRSLNYGIMILNYSMASLRNMLTKEIWDNAIIRGCADGGANMLKSYADEKNENFLPDYISGDFDSIDSNVYEYYQSISSVDLIKTQDQNATDFTKCVRVMMGKQSALNHLLVFCSLGGRFDHTTGIIHSLYALNQTYPTLQIYVITECDITFLLHANRLNRISIQSKYNGKICSLLPFGQTAHVRTEGLKWNLNPTQELSFTKLVSSSNSYESDEITHVDVCTDSDIIWTMTYTCNKK